MSGARSSGADQADARTLQHVGGHTCSECERFLDKGKSHLCELFQDETKLGAVWRGDWPACGMWEKREGDEMTDEPREIAPCPHAGVRGASAHYSTASTRASIMGIKRAVWIVNIASGDL
jgi:hypothetical protein